MARLFFCHDIRLFQHTPTTITKPNLNLTIDQELKVKPNPHSFHGGTAFHYNDHPVVGGAALWAGCRQSLNHSIVLLRIKITWIIYRFYWLLNLIPKKPGYPAFLLGTFGFLSKFLSMNNFHSIIFFSLF
ncbi:MAG: hypothetical protein FD166_1460 [Bacteroidetes bacterium]|nr:MAG: hypothetical protein FD166_1460 [Bacteroidota bacterium]